MPLLKDKKGVGMLVKKRFGEEIEALLAGGLGGRKKHC
jgi:hypothetical protein